MVETPPAGSLTSSPGEDWNYYYV